MIKIKPDIRNTNQHTVHGLALLEKSVEKIGVIESYTVSSDDVIISGNARHEVLGRKFEKDPIVVEIEGDQPVVIKRTDIKSGTKMFHEASILANTTAHKNFNLDTELIEEIAVEFDIDIEDVGVEIYNPDNIDLDSFFEENNEDKEQKNKIILEYIEEDFTLVTEAFSKHSGSKEQIVFKLLGL
jgi:hypothetical protein